MNNYKNKFLRILLLLFVLINIKCTKEELDQTENNEDYKITTIYEKNNLDNGKRNNDLFPEVLKIESVGKKTDIATNLLSVLVEDEIELLDLSKIERLTMSSTDRFIYSIPFLNDNTKLIMATDNNKVSIVIANQERINNGNDKFIIKNRVYENVFTVEQNSDNKFGNTVHYDNEHGYVITDFSFPYSNVDFQKVNLEKSSCLLEHPDSFSDCMQCGWEECSSSWVCGAILAIRPVEVLATAAAVCGLNTLANLR